METTVDKFGRILLPKPIRDELGLRAGAVLEIEEEAGGVVLRAKRDQPMLSREGDVLVYQGAAVGDIEGALRETREDRSHAISVEKTAQRT